MRPWLLQSSLVYEERKGLRQMEDIFQTDEDDKTVHNSIRCNETEEKGDKGTMINEVITALRALVNIFDLISRNLNKRR